MNYCSSLLLSLSLFHIALMFFQTSPNCLPTSSLLMPVLGLWVCLDVFIIIQHCWVGDQIEQTETFPAKIVKHVCGGRWIFESLAGFC